MATKKEVDGHFLVDLTALELDDATLRRIENAIQEAVKKELAAVSDLETASLSIWPPHTMGLIMR
jgi:hypothetical protein